MYVALPAVNISHLFATLIPLPRIPAFIVETSALVLATAPLQALVERASAAPVFSLHSILARVVAAALEVPLSNPSAFEEPVLKCAFNLPYAFAASLRMELFRNRIASAFSVLVPLIMSPSLLLRMALLVQEPVPPTAREVLLSRPSAALLATELLFAKTKLALEIPTSFGVIPFVTAIPPLMLLLPEKHMALLLVQVDGALLRS